MTPTSPEPTADRGAQTFPTLTPAQVETARRFASSEPRRFATDELVFAIGDRDAPAWLVLEGMIEITRRDGPCHEADLTTHTPGQFIGDVSQLSGAPPLAAGHAGADGCTAVPFDAAHLRALMVGSADVGEVAMRADSAPRRPQPSSAAEREQLGAGQAGVSGPGNQEPQQGQHAVEPAASPGPASPAPEQTAPQPAAGKPEEPPVTPRKDRGPRRVVFRPGRSWDYAIFQRHVTGEKLLMLKIRDPFACASPANRGTLIDFVKMLQGAAVGIDVVSITCWDAETALPEGRESNPDQRRDLETRWEQRVGCAPRAKMSPVSGRQVRKFHDRFVEATTASGRRLIWDFGRGVDGMMSASKECVIVFTEE